jgi:glutamate-1-semialdehyde 2,1-aminomutase
VAAGLKTLEIISRPGFFDQLNKKSVSFFESTKNLIKQKSWPLSLNYVNSMGCLFFKEGGVTNFAEATQSDTNKFAEFFGKLIEQGIYIAPSQFEAMFISSAHSDKDLGYTADTIKSILDKIL